jgi:hypothetical protein
MKTYTKYLRIANQNILIALLVLITLFGLSIKTKAQNPTLGNDELKIKTSMKIKLNSFDFDVLVPKITTNELEALMEVNFNHLVYVSDLNPGFYKFFNNQWVKKSIKEVLEVIEVNIAMGKPLIEDIILTGNNDQSLLDYNSHVDHLYEGFFFEEGSTQLAILINN